LQWGFSTEDIDGAFAPFPRMCAAEREHSKGAIRVDALNHESDFIKVCGYDNARRFRDGVSRCCEEVSTGIHGPQNAGAVQLSYHDIPNGAFLCRWARRVDEVCQ
jgi:hypothetical protein